MDYTYIVFIRYYKVWVTSSRKIVRNNRIQRLDEWFYDRIHRDLHHNNRIKDSLNSFTIISTVISAVQIGLQDSLNSCTDLFTVIFTVINSFKYSRNESTIEFTDLYLIIGLNGSHNRFTVEYTVIYHILIEFIDWMNGSMV